MILLRNPDKMIGTAAKKKKKSLAFKYHFFKKQIYMFSLIVKLFVHKYRVLPSPMSNNWSKQNTNCNNPE